MKKYVFLLMASLLTCASALASFSITVNIDRPDRLILSYIDKDYNTVTFSGLVAGDNILTFDNLFYSLATLRIQAAGEDSKIASVYCNTTDTPEPNYNPAETNISLNEATHADYRYTITTASYADVRTASATFVVDEADRVRLQRMPFYAAVTLQDGTNDIRFVPEGVEGETREYFTIRPVGDLPFHSLTVNGTAQTPDRYGDYILYLADGDRVEIAALFPDETAPVRFVAADKASEGFIADVLVDGVSAPDWAADDFAVRLGSTVTIVANTDDYEFVSATLDDADPLTYWYSDYTFAVVENRTYTFAYTARPYETFPIGVHIDAPDHILLYLVDALGNKQPLDLTAGDNTLTFSTKAEGLAFLPAEGYKVESFRDAAGTEYKDNTQYETIPVKEGDRFTITTAPIARTAQAVFYVDDPTLSVYGGWIVLRSDDYDRSTRILSFQDDGLGTPLIQAGYNTIAFDPSYDNPVRISVSTPVVDIVRLYHNGTLLPAETSSVLDLTDGDVLRLYLRDAPETYTVAFDAAEGCGFADVVRDRLVPVTDLSEPLGLLADTEISFRLTGTTVVTANGTALTPDEDGVYTLRINDHTILYAGLQTALPETDAPLSGSVYSLTGVLLIRDATPAQIDALPAGAYIICGKTTYLLHP